VKSLALDLAIDPLVFPRVKVLSTAKLVSLLNLTKFPELEKCPLEEIAYSYPLSTKNVDAFRFIPAEELSTRVGLPVGLTKYKRLFTPLLFEVFLCTYRFPSKSINDALISPDPEKPDPLKVVVLSVLVEKLYRITLRFPLSYFVWKAIGLPLESRQSQDAAATGSGAIVSIVTNARVKIIIKDMETLKTFIKNGRISLKRR
jgi:hypothetical protein